MYSLFKPQGGLRVDNRTGAGIQNSPIGELDDKWILLRASALFNTTPGTDVALAFAAVDNELTPGQLDVSGCTGITFIVSITGMTTGPLSIIPKFTDLNSGINAELSVPVGAAVVGIIKPADYRNYRPRFTAAGVYIFNLPVPACKYMKIFLNVAAGDATFSLYVARGWQNYNLNLI